MITKEQKQQFSAGCLLGFGILGLLICAVARGCQEIKKISDKSENNKVVEAQKFSVHHTR